MSPITLEENRAEVDAGVSTQQASLAPSISPTSDAESSLDAVQNLAITPQSSLANVPISMSAGADPWADPAPGMNALPVSDQRTHDGEGGQAAPTNSSQGSTSGVSSGNPWATGEAGNSAGPAPSAHKLAGQEEYGLPKLGHDAARYWNFKKGFTNLNNGSYGACPIPVLEAWKALSDKAEENPDLFLLRTRDELLQSALSRLSRILNCPASTLALIPNATTASNAVLRDLYFQDGDGVLTLNVGYGAVNKTLAYLYETHNNLKTKLHDVIVPIKLPATDEEICGAVEEAIRTASSKQIKIRLGVFDAISSMPGVKLPWVKLVEVLRKHDILSFVDGAHAFAQIPIDLQAADPDFFVSNIHKWGYAHRGCAVFYVPERNQHLQRSSLPTSWSYVEKAQMGTNTWAEQWAANGTIDHSSFLSVDAALTFAEKLGGYERLRRYTHDLARKGATQVSRILGGELLDPEGERTTAMVNVRVPIAAHVTKGDANAWFAAARPWFWSALQDEFKTAIPLYTYDSKIWARFSAQVWLEVSDFEWGARALRELVRRVNTGEVSFVDGNAVEANSFGVSQWAKSDSTASTASTTTGDVS